MNEVLLPYLTFLELYKFQIINLISIVYNKNEADSIKMWNEATINFNRNVYKIMQEIIKKTKGGVKILLNREIAAYNSNII